MLFLIDADGVPSVATMITVAPAAPPPPPPPPKATFVQARQKRITSGTVNSLAFSSPNTAGNLSVVYVAWSNAGPVTISDTRGNTYAPVAPATAWGTTQGWRSQLFYAKNIAGGSNTVTARFGSGISGFGKLLIHEYSGLDRTAPLDASASNIGTAAAMDSGSAATTKADDLIFGAASSSSNVTAAGGGLHEPSERQRVAHRGPERHFGRLLQRDRHPERHGLGHARGGVQSRLEWRLGAHRRRRRL